MGRRRLTSQTPALVAATAALVCAGAVVGCGGDLKTWRIPSEAMAPTLKLGATVQSDPSRRRPALGQLAVFHPPAGADPATGPICGNPTEGLGHPRPCGVPVASTSTEVFIKRVVGLPGDRIALKDGVVVRNGTPEREPYIASCGQDPADCTFPRAVVLPAGTYFVLGDNRGASDDSRFWGPVRARDIVGVVVSCDPSSRYCTHG